MTYNDKQTKKELFKSTSIIGGTQLVSIILGIVRTKVIAILLGPSGVGIAGMLQSIIDTIKSATSFGINYSSVKDIAQANETQDEIRIATTIKIMRRWVVCTGLLGVLITVLLCYPLSLLSFDSPNYAISIAIVSVAILITNISAGQIALLQGMRLIKEMAKASLWGAVIGTAVILPIYWWLGIDGIIPAMILSALFSLATSWWYSKKVQLAKVGLTFKQTYHGGLSMAKLGFFIVISGFISLATIYIVRVVIVDKGGVDAVGYFQAAWMITNIYMSLVLNAMLADFFPRLSAIISDKKGTVNLVNQQMELALLLGGILVVSLMTFSELAINILYSSKFIVAVPVLQWQMLGALLVFIGWPLGVIFLSTNKGNWVVITDTLWCVLYFVLIYFGWDYFGFNVLGIAYVIAIAVKLIITYFLAKQIVQYQFSKTNIKYIVILLISSISILCLQTLIDNVLIKMIVSSFCAMITICYCLIELNKHIGLFNMIKTKLLKK